MSKENHVDTATETTTHRVGRWVGLRPWKRHSRVVMVGGLIYIMYGLSLLVIPLTADKAAAFHMQLLWTHGYIQPWGIAWCLVGFAALASTRWPPTSEKWGYAALSGWSSLWGCFYACILFSHPAVATAGILVWGLLTLLWMGVAGFPNPEDVVIVHGDSTSDH